MSERAVDRKGQEVGAIEDRSSSGGPPGEMLRQEFVAAAILTKPNDSAKDATPSNSPANEGAP